MTTRDLLYSAFALVLREQPDSPAKAMELLATDPKHAPVLDLKLPDLLAALTVKDVLYFAVQAGEK